MDLIEGFQNMLEPITHFVEFKPTGGVEEFASEMSEGKSEISYSTFGSINRLNK